MTHFKFLKCTIDKSDTNIRKENNNLATTVYQTNMIQCRVMYHYSYYTQTNYYLSLATHNNRSVKLKTKAIKFANCKYK